MITCHFLITIVENVCLGFRALPLASVTDAPVDEVIVVGEADEREHELPDQVQHSVDNPQQPEGDDYLGDELGPGEPLGLAAHLELELEAVVGAGPPRISVVGDHLLHLKDRLIVSHTEACATLYPA